MNVTPIVNNSVTPQNFKGNNERKTGGGGKAFASAIIPGLGQFIDGRTGAGVGFLGGSIGAAIVHYNLSKDYNKILNYEMAKLNGNTVMKNGKMVVDLTKSKYSNPFKLSMDAMKSPNVVEALKSPKMRKAKLLGLGMFALWVINIIDAGKGSKNKN